MKRLVLGLIFVFPLFASAAYIVDQGGTGAQTFSPGTLLSGNGKSAITGTSTPYVSAIVATSTTASSSLVGLDAFMFRIRNLGAGLLKTNSSGYVGLATAGTDYESPLSFIYPLVRAVNSISLAFGTTTANSWSAHNIFSSLFATNASSTYATTSSLYVTGIIGCAEALETDGSGKVVCGTDATGGAGGGTTTPSLVYSGTNLDRQNTTTNQILLGATATSSLSRLEVNGGITVHDTATATSFVATGTNPSKFFAGVIVSGTATSTNTNLQVYGTATASLFNAASTTATSTFNGGILSTLFSSTTQLSVSRGFFQDGLTDCSGVQYLQYTLSSGKFGCSTPSGGGGGSGAWATNTQNTLSYLTSAWTAAIGAIATSTNARLEVYGTSSADQFVASSTVNPSIFYRASTTFLNLSGIAPSSLLKLNGSGVVTGATAGTDYENALTFNYPLSRSVNAISSLFSTTTNTGMSQGSLYVGSGGIMQTTATGTVSNGTGISVTAGQSIIGSGLTITNTGVTSISATYPEQVSGATGAITISTALATTGPSFTIGNATIGTLTATSSASTTNLVVSRVATTSDLFILNGATSSGTLVSQSGTSSLARLTVSGLASSSILAVSGGFFQDGLADCTGVANKVVYTLLSGKFGCSTDQTGSGGSPASPDTSVQFNNGGSFGGSPSFVWDNAAQGLSVADSGNTASSTLKYNALTATGTQFFIASYMNGGDVVPFLNLNSDAMGYGYDTGGGEVRVYSDNGGGTYPGGISLIPKTSSFGTGTVRVFDSGEVNIITEFASSTLSTTTFQGGVFSLNGVYGGNQYKVASCDLKADATTGSFYCGTDATGVGGTSTDTPWQMIPSGVRLTTTTNQVLIGALSTTTSSALEVVGTTTATFFDARAFGAYKQNNKVILNGSSTSGILLIGEGAGASLVPTTTANSGNTAIGYLALNTATSVSRNTAIGYRALSNMIAGGNLNSIAATDNTAVGHSAMSALTTGITNTGVGDDVMYSLTTGVSNNGFGESSLGGLTTGRQNATFGAYSGPNGDSSYNTVVGNSSLSFSGGTKTGNSIFGFQSGCNVSSGSYNILLGIDTNCVGTLDTGSFNVIIGQNVDAISSTASGTLNIGNVLYGSGLYSGATMSSQPISSAKIGIGTTTPYAKLAVVGETVSSFFTATSGTSTFPDILTTSFSSTTQLSVSRGFFQGGLTDCTGTTFLQYTLSTGKFGCATPSGGTGTTSVPWQFIFSQGLVRLSTTSNQVLIGGSATTSLSNLEVVGEARAYNFVGTSTATSTFKNLNGEYWITDTSVDFGRQVVALYKAGWSEHVIINVAPGNYTQSATAWPINASTTDKKLTLRCAPGNATIINVTGGATSTILNFGNNGTIGVVKSWDAIENCTFNGDLTSGQVGIVVGGTQGAQGANLKNVMVHNMDKGIVIGNQVAAGLTLDGVVSQYNNKNFVTEFDTNAGEGIFITNFNFSDCQTGHMAKCVYFKSTSGSSISMTNGRIDDGQLYVADGNLRLTIDKVHFENPNAAAVGKYTFVVIGEGGFGFGATTIQNSTFWNGAAVAGNSPYSFIYTENPLTLKDNSYQSDTVTMSSVVTVGGSSGRLTDTGAFVPPTGLFTNFATSSSVDMVSNPFSHNIGIGTSTPYSRLSVVGQIVSTYLTATSTSATSSLPNLYSAFASSTNIFNSSFFQIGMTNCNTGATDKVLYNSSTGKFSCGTDAGGSGGSSSGSYGNVQLGNGASGFISTPLFSVSTSSFGTFLVVGTTTNQWGQVSSSTAFVAGPIESSNVYVGCDSISANYQAAITADSNMTNCPGFIFDESVDGEVRLITAGELNNMSTTTQYVVMGGGNSGPAAGDGMAIRLGSNTVSPTSSPMAIFETEVRIHATTNATSSTHNIYFAGFTSHQPTITTGNASLNLHPSDGAYFFAASTSNNWVARTVSNNTFTETVTTIATSTPTTTDAWLFRTLRVEMASTSATFLINGRVVARHTTNLPTRNLGPIVSHAVATAGGLPSPIHVAKIKAWLGFVGRKP